MIAPIIELRGVGRRFGRPPGRFGGRGSVVHAVQGVDLAIGRGEVVGLVGESGCGKSTLGRLAAGLLPPTEGEVLFDGRGLAGLPAVAARRARLKVQMIFQDPYGSLNPRMRAGEIVGEAPRVHGLIEGGYHAYVDAQFRRAGLDPALKQRFPHQFSGGQRQRIGIARALAVRPEVLVCDEAVAALDVSIQAQILNLFMDLREQLGLTYLFISHDLGVVEHLSDRVAVMYLGRVVEQAPAAAVFAQPNHPYTQALLAEIPRIEARRRRFSALKGELPSPLHPPSGCPFHPRCPHAMPRCDQAMPALREVAAGHRSACYLNEMTLMDQHSAMVTMRDGVRLATSIHLPGGDGPFPVIMERTPYGRDETSRSEVTAADPTPMRRAAFAGRFTSHGYAVVFQDCRGRYGSEGEFVKYLSDGEDGFDTCAWLIAQPWCDGRICTMGLSYAAHTQAALGCLDPPGLAAQVLDSGGFCNAWTGGIRQFGAFELKQATWAHKQARLSPEAVADPVLATALDAEDIREWFTRMPWRPGHSPLRHHPAYEAYLLEQWTHGPFDDYWRQLGIWAEGWHDRYSRAACVHMSSWFDPYPLTATGNFTGLKRAGRGPQRLILGPWTHGDRSQTRFGDVEFGPDATIDSWAGDWAGYRLRFFDQVIKGVPDGEPPVRIFVMGGGSGRRTALGHLDHGGHWITATDWPVPEARPVAYHLRADGTLSPDAPAVDAPPLCYDYDPRRPVPTIGGNLTSLEPVAVGGSFDQVEAPAFFGCAPPYLPLASRPDVLAFQTPKLTAPVLIVGPIEAELTVATDAPDTDFTAKLIDVHPPSADYPRGYAMILTDGIVRLRYADDPAGTRLRQPGEEVRIRVTLFPTANLFLPGHRIRLDIASSNFPKFDVNPNTGEPEGQSRRFRTATNTVFTDAARPSLVTLPALAM